MSMAMHARAWARLQRDAKQEDAGNGSQRLKRQQRCHDHPLPQHQQQHARQQQDRPVARLEACEAGTCSDECARQDTLEPCPFNMVMLCEQAAHSADR